MHCAKNGGTCSVCSSEFEESLGHSTKSKKKKSAGGWAGFALVILFFAYIFIGAKFADWIEQRKAKKNIEKQ